MPSLTGRRKEDRGEMTVDIHGVDHDGVRGVWTRGETPKELILSDGTALRLQSAEAGSVGWRREDRLNGRRHSVSVTEAAELAGSGYPDYVGVRTRSEVEWLRAVADWCSGEAGRLEAELAHPG
jgi:hypothetical protein